MNARYDVVIVGGGVMGSSVAYHLKTLEPALSVLVVERDPTYARASSALSASSIRQQFSEAVNVRLSQLSFDFMRDIGEHLAVDGEKAEIGLVERGYLYLASDDRVPAMRAGHAVQTACGARVALLDAAALAARFPWLATDGVALASLGLAGEGWFDGFSLLQAFRRKARSLGALYHHGEVCGLSFEGGSATVRMTDGSSVACGRVVDAAGPHAAQVAGMAGIRIPVVPERHCVFVFDCATPLPGCPLVIDPGGAWFRPEGRRFIAGPPQEPAGDSALHLHVDHGLFDDVLWPLLAARVPAFEAIRRVSAWAGFYEMNTFDCNALIGAFAERPELLLINGFSGHGIQQSPAAGLALAELIVHGGWRTLDVGALSPERLRQGRPRRELNII